MVAVTFDVARVPAPNMAAKAAPHKSWFARFMDALIEARLQQAQRELRLHTALLPYVFDERGNRLVKTGVNDMPFGV
jgi:hypothetical protein